MSNYSLSKSSFIKGLQCDKYLYLHKNNYKLKDPLKHSTQAVFDQGNQIGLLARSLFPDGVDCSPSTHFKIIESVKKTMNFIENAENIIYEATFIFNEILAALDILVKDNEGWKAYEVKSSTSIKDTYIKDAAIQYYTIINSGINLVDISIVYVNKKYIYNGYLEKNKFFTIKSVKDKVLEYLPSIPNKISRFKNILDLDSTPKIDIGPHCLKPYECDFKGTCWKHIPENSIFNISNLRDDKKFELYNKGVITLDQIDLSETKLSDKQIIQVECQIDGKTHINKEKIENFLNNLNYPLYFLDFETINPAIPLFLDTSPYQQVLFQYSLHIQKSENSKPLHKEYLQDPSKESEIELIRKLVNDCEGLGDILVYNIGFEKGVIKKLIHKFPDYKFQLQSIVDRLKDLMIIFKNKWFYKPEMKGSSSIKDVLTALDPELSYKNINIQDGGMASSIYLSMVNKTFKGDEISMRKNLQEYCWLDTYGMVKIIEKLKEF
ncbi:MAG: hypothetical protein CMC48_02945 [Flavobacteriaceae bacterium]|nr:hypothetical protein [Flavobacteriaceae bacterium]|tara:strand:+ start:16 stop:1494 length:1479 start_codon:yes stop_codon:yes gene_type:complete